MSDLTISSDPLPHQQFPLRIHKIRRLVMQILIPDQLGLCRTTTLFLLLWHLEIVLDEDMREDQLHQVGGEEAAGTRAAAEAEMHAAVDADGGEQVLCGVLLADVVAQALVAEAVEDVGRGGAGDDVAVAGHGRRGDLDEGAHGEGGAVGEGDGFEDLAFEHGHVGRGVPHRFFHEGVQFPELVESEAAELALVLFEDDGFDLAAEGVDVLGTRDQVVQYVGQAAGVGVDGGEAEDEFEVGDVVGVDLAFGPRGHLLLEPLQHVRWLFVIGSLFTLALVSLVEN